MPEQLPSISQPSTSIQKEIVKSGRDATEAKKTTNYSKPQPLGHFAEFPHDNLSIR